MTTYHSASSVTGNLSDLDGFSVRGDAYLPSHSSSTNHAESDDFGFDPPSFKHPYSMKMEQTYSPPEDAKSPLCAWSIYDQKKEDSTQLSPNSNLPPTELDRLVAQTLPGASNAISRYGQVTPPRSNSESSITEKAQIESPKSSAAPERRSKRTTKPTSKTTETTGASATNNKKRRNTRKSSVVSTGNPEEDEKRRQSLEKNRLAAAKCRVNKKEKTEQLQRDSHEKAVHNAFLKEQVMRMKEEVQQMNALLLGHASCDGCKSPEDIQKHLSDLGNEFFQNHMPSMLTQDFGGFPNMPMDMEHLDDDQVMQGSYFSPSHHPQSLLNPPLPNFDQSSEFDVQTPMQTD